jgi:TIR domain
MSDFFVSYTKPDEAWAEWISWVLEEADFSVTVQAWDFGAGGNFVLQMQRAAVEAKRTLAVLSPDYLTSRFAAPEWAAAFAADPDGLKRRLVPVRVRACRLDGLWNALNHIDLVGVDEPTAQARPLAGIRGQRGKPQQRPQYPGSAMMAHERPQFPGSVQTSEAQGTSPYIPALRASHTDLDKRKFIRESFTAIAGYFERGLAAMAEQNKGVDYEFTRESASGFAAEIFVSGKSRCRCRVWVDSQLGEGIAYYEGNDWGGRSNAFNEMLSVSEDEGNLVLSAQMSSVAFGRVGEGLDLNRLNSVQAADYLWRRLMFHLG